MFEIYSNNLKAFTTMQKAAFQSMQTATARQTKMMSDLMECHTAIAVKKADNDIFQEKYAETA